MLRIKESEWQRFCDNAEKLGFSRSENDFYKRVTNKRELWVYSYNKEITSCVLDSTTYCGYKYRGEYHAIVKPYIQDLIQQGYVEKVEE